MNAVEAKKILKDAPKTKDDYLEILSLFDAATCEALAIGQKIAGRLVDSHIGWATYVFAQMCARASAIMRVAPHSRWVKSDFDDWHFSPIAGFTRSIIESLQLFCYLMQPVSSESESKARVDLLYLYDCSTRLRYFTNLESQEEMISFGKDQEKIKDRLRSNSYFLSLPEKLQMKCLTGKLQMFLSPEEAAEAAGYDRKSARLYWDFLSQNIHILSMGFSRMEPNGRGTGIENVTDRSYISAALLVSASALNQATMLLMHYFPDAADVRKGIRSQFSPGPKENSLRNVSPPQRSNQAIADFRRDTLSISIQEAIGVENVLVPQGFWLDCRANRFVAPAYNIGVFRGTFLTEGEPERNT